MKSHFDKIILFIFFLNRIKFSNSQGYISMLNGESHNGKNYYYATLYIGEEKKPHNFLLDTTSSLISYQCKFHSSITSPNFEITKEKDIINCQNGTCPNYPYSFCSNNQCHYEYNYNNSTFKGKYAKNYISLSTEIQSYIFPMGCSNSDFNEYFYSNADGILGLNYNNSFVNLLYQKKLLQKNLFSMCLNSNQGGYLSFGQIIENNKEEKDYNKKIINYVYYTPTQNGMYKLSMTSLHIDDGLDLLNGNEVDSIIDSLSTKNYLTESLYNSFILEFLVKCQKMKNNCNNIQKIENMGFCSVFKSKQKIINSIDKYWPKINIAVNGYSLAIKPKNYFVPYLSSGEINACVGFGKSNTNYNILGTSFMNGYDVIFDNENKRIGFIESNCDIKLKKIEEYQNRVFDDPVNIIIICISFFGIIILIIVLIFLYKEFYCNKQKRKGYIRQVDVNNSYYDKKI